MRLLLGVSTRRQLHYVQKTHDESVDRPLLQTRPQRRLLETCWDQSSGIKTLKLNALKILLKLYMEKVTSTHIGLKQRPKDQLTAMTRRPVRPVLCVAALRSG